MASSSPSRKRKDLVEEERRRNEALVAAKPKKTSRPKRVELPVQAKPHETREILAQINKKINEFLDLMATSRNSPNLEDLAFAALEKRTGKPMPAEGDFSRFCSPRGIKSAMELAVLLDTAAKTNNPKLLEKWA